MFTKTSQVARPLWIKITACGFGAVLVTSLAVGGLAFRAQKSAGEERIRSELTRGLRVIQEDMLAQQRSASALAVGLSAEADLAGLLQRKDRAEILKRFTPIMGALKRDADLHLITLSDASATVIARAHQPDVFGDSLTGRRKMVVQALATGRATSGIEPGREFLSIFTTVPVMVDGKAVGTVDVGTSLTNDYFARLKKTTGADIAVRLLRNGAFETQNSTYSKGPMLSADEMKAVMGGGTVQRTAQDGDRTVAVGGLPIKDFAGQTIGVIEVGADVGAVAAALANALWASVLTTLAICALVLGGFYVYARRIAGSISGLTGVMDQLASGDLAVDVPYREGADEVGAMARAVEVFKANAVKARELEAQAAAARQEADAERSRAEAQRAAAAKEQQAVVERLADGLARLSEGDLTVRVEGFPVDYAQLEGDFNAALGKLEEAMTVIARGGAAIQSGSGEITQAADDLSKRTEQQAASLEETAAALEEITSTVKQTAQGAKHAQDVVLTAKADAEASGRVVQDAVAAMNEIEKSSTEISKIIGVIDEIAFQTNLLALNAGVEAARAGDAGRGFAVVASEVRALAQRSAEAAKQIKELISSSTAQVASGVDLVGETGNALNRIVRQVADITGIVGEIAASAQEQATGLEQVNTAVSQMDQITQQNAAMVEQSTAASQSLKGEAEQLNVFLGRFVVAERATSVVSLEAARSATPKSAPVRKRSAPAAAATSRGKLATARKRAAEPAEWEDF